MAEETGNVLGDIRAQFQSFFESLSLSKRIALFSILGVVLIGMIALIYVANRETWVPLYSNISPEDAATVKQALEKNQISVLVGPGGQSVLVPSDRADEARLVLAGERVSLGGGMGFADLFVGATGIGETDFQQQVKFRVALEGELARLIGRLKSVRSAKVSLALPKKSLFLREEEKPTASVVVEPQPGQELSAKEVLTIAFLVANSVEGLKKENVVVVDTGGRLLSQGISDETAAGRVADQLAYRQSVEQALERKIINQLEPVVGPDRARARVSVEMTFDRVTMTEERFDPEGSVIRSEQVSSEESTGTRTIPVGIPGVTSNLPEQQAGASEVANVSQLNRATETRNFENSRLTRISEPAVGKITHVSVSVLVDGKYRRLVDPESGQSTRQYQAWSTEELNHFNRLVRAAVGYDEKRGDSVEVINMQFQAPLEEDISREIEETTRAREFMLDILRFTFLGVGLLALILFVIRPMVQRLSAKPEDLDLLMGLPATIGELEGEELEIPTTREAAGIPPRDKIMEMARTDPLATASMVRNWLREKR
jgi:flagellar M-ring protein FliF